MKHRLLMAGAIAALAGAPALGATATIDAFTFDLDQFSDASVTTNVGTNVLAGSTFDNPAGIDGVTLGELATAHFGGDFGDRITLGIDNSVQDSLTLSYGSNPYTLGAGDASKFVVYEQSGRTFVDPEGQNFDISFDGGTTWVDAINGIATSVGLPSDPGATRQNQIVFDLTDTLFGYSVGDQISSVMLRNQTGTGSLFDPDFLFAGFAGGGVVIPTPTAVAGGFAMCGLLGAGYRRRSA